MRKLIAIMPPIDPIPKISIRSRATAGDGITGSINSINAALPARPWTMPIKIDLGLNRWCEVSEPGS